MPGCCFFQEVYQLGQDNFGTTENTAIQILLCNKVVTMQLFSHQNFTKYSKGEVRNTNSFNLFCNIVAL